MINKSNSKKVEPIFHSIVLFNECKDNKTKIPYMLKLCNELKLKEKKFIIYSEYTYDDIINFISKLKEIKIRIEEFSAELSKTQRNNISKKLKNGELDGLVILANSWCHEYGERDKINIPYIDSIIIGNISYSTSDFNRKVEQGLLPYKNKENCDVYEILLNREKDLSSVEENFVDYKNQGFVKSKMYVDNNGCVIEDIKVLRIADIEFINAENADKTGVGSYLVGNNTLAFFNIHHINDDNLEDILQYKSFKYGRDWKHFVFKYGYGINSKVIWCYSGFSSILIRLLQNKYNYTINGKELYRAKEIKNLPSMKSVLLEFQRKSVQAWIDYGCYGIISNLPLELTSKPIECFIIKKMNVRTIILVKNRESIISWVNALQYQFGNQIKEQIGLIGLSKNGDFYSNICKDIVISTYEPLLFGDTLTSLGKEQFKLVIVDNVHKHNIKDFEKIVGNIRAPYKLGTLILEEWKNYKAKPIIYALLGDIRFIIDRESITYEDYCKIVDKENDIVQKTISSFCKSDCNGINREPIPQQVKMYVWQRDGGRCASCKSDKKLEYDHIIPVSKGGSNTERNIQLLCQDCNRTKSANI